MDKKIDQNIKSEWHPALHFFGRLDELEKSGNYYCVEIASGSCTTLNLRRFYGVLVAMGYMIRTLLVEEYRKRLDNNLEELSNLLQNPSLEKSKKKMKELAQKELVMYRDLQQYAQLAGLGLPVQIKKNLKKQLKEDLL